MSNIRTATLAKAEEVELLYKFLKEVGHPAPGLLAFVVLLTQEVHDNPSRIIAICGMSASITLIKTPRTKVWEAESTVGMGRSYKLERLDLFFDEILLMTRFIFGLRAKKLETENRWR